MASLTKISWADATFNPWIGCTKVSPGCAHCYAEARDKRHMIEPIDHWGKGAPRHHTSAAYWRQPLAWNKQSPARFDGPHTQFGPRPRVFCGSLCDVFDHEVNPEWRDQLFDLIYRCQNLDWLLLTKRPAYAIGYLIGTSGAGAEAFKANFPNVWMGVSIEDQPRADERIPLLLQIPAKVRFLSVEPMLGEISLRWLSAWQRADASPTGLLCDRTGATGHESTDEFDGARCLNWVICGGESGPHCRPMELAWARSLRDQCKTAIVPFWMKQLGGHPNSRHRLEDLPEDLRVRELPHA